MSDKVTRVLLEIMAIDKATTVLKTMMNSLQGWADTMNGVGAKTELSAEELEIAQVRLQGASDAEAAALERQAAALGTLQAAQEKVTLAQRAQMDADAALAEANAQLQDTTITLAADFDATYDTLVKKSAEAAAAVKASVDEQVAAYDKLMAADALVAKRSAQVADAQVAAGEETAAATTAGVGKAGPIMFAAGAAAAYLAVKTTKMAADFQSSMTKLVTSAGESQSAMDMVGAGVLKISDQTGISAEELAKALYYVDSAGYHAGQSLTILTAAAKGARDEQADTATVTNALTTIMKNYGLSADKATMVMNQMIQAVSLGKTNLQDFSSALAQVLPVAAANSISFAQVGAALATMTAKGMSAQQAAQDLAFSIRSLSKPNGVAITEMGQLGLTATQVQKSLGSGPDGLSNTFIMLSNTVMSKMGPAGTLLLSAFNQSKDAALKAKTMFDALPPSLQKLAQSLENGTIGAHQWALTIRNLDPVQQKMMQQFATMYTNSQAFANQVTSRATPATQTYATAMSNLMGGAAGLNTALMLVSGKGMNDYTDNVQKMDAVTNRANKEVDGWSVVQGTFNQKLSESKQTLVNTGIAIGQVLLPYATKFLDLVMKILAPIGEWISRHQKLIGVILAVIGPILLFAGTFMTLMKVVGLAEAAVYALNGALLTLLDNPIVLAIAAIAVAAYLIVTHWTAVKNFLIDVWNWLKGAAKATADFFVRIWHDIYGPIKKAWDDIAAFLQDVWTGFKFAWDKTGGKLVHEIAHAWDVVSGAVTKEWDRISNDLSQIWGELVTIWNDTGGKLVSFISDNWDTIAQFTSNAWHVIFDPIKAAFNIIVSFVKLNLSILKTIIKAVWDAIYGTAKTSWDLIWGLIKSSWDIIVGIIKAAIQIVWGLIKSGFDTIKGVIEAAWDYITGAINTALDFIKDILKVFIDVITGKWGQAWKDVQKMFLDIWNNLKSTFSSILNDIKGAVFNAAKDIGTGFINGIRDAANGVTHAAQDIWNSIVRFFKDSINWLVQAGMDLVQGLINGIENWAGHLWDSLSNLASGILGKIGNFLGLGSPSRITHQYGIYLVEGLVNGINASAGKAANAARSLALGVLAGSRTTLGNVTLAAAGVGSPGLFAGSAAGGTGRSTANVTLDLRGAQIAGPQSVQWITDQINKNFVQKVVPTAGITLRRTGG